MFPTNAGIQKRLKRQGSKFAGAEAFRVYKFTDGAWSDIILGAVMGAAHRAEAVDRTTGRPSRLHAHGMAPHGIVAMPQQTLMSGIQLPLQAGHGPNQSAQPPVANYMPMPPQQPPASVMTSTRRPAPQPFNRASFRKVDPEHQSRFGPYAQTYQPEPRREPPAFATAPQGPRVPWPQPPPLPEADVMVKAANDTAMIMPLSRTPLSEPATAEQSNAPADKIEVTLSRDTATFSLPASEAHLPQSLKAAFENAKSLANSSPQTVPLTGTEAGPLSVEHLEVALDSEETVQPVVTSTELTARDLAFIGRIAPQAAE